MLLLAMLGSLELQSQLLDDFEDGDLTADPPWWGQTDRFGISGGELQLQAPASESVAYLFTPAPTSLDQNTVWAFKVRLEFAPSTSNFAVVYLSASNPDLTGPQEAYYLKIGGISGAEDAIELFRQDEDQHTLLISGTAGGAGASPVLANVLVSRSGLGEWVLSVDYSGGEDYQIEGAVQDATYPEGLYAGVLCRFTSTRRESFFFDNFRVDPVVPDNKAPSILSVDVLSATELELFLDEPVQSGSALDLQNYAINNGIGAPVSALFSDNSFTQIQLTLAQPLVDQTAYVLTANVLTDFAGNGAASQISFNYFELLPPAPGDLILNEILFNPQTGGRDFIELYNLSSKVLNLEGLKLINTQSQSSNREKEIQNQVLLFPKEYLVLTPDTDDIRDRYNAPDPDRLVENVLPTLEDKLGNLTLEFNGQIIDAFDYQADFHFSLLARQDGVSLERISFNAPTNERGNWHSAASSVGFATPGYLNSQFVERSSMLDEMISLPNPRLSPDGDGFEDVLLIQYKTDKPGYLINLRIFDAQGRLVNHLVRNELLANEGTFKWDGFTNEFTKARIGIYVLWFELFDASGKVEERKETCVVAGRL